MIKKITNIIFFILFLSAIISLMYISCYYKSDYYEDVENISGKILDINYKKGNTKLIVKSKEKYILTTNKKLNYKLGDEVLINANVNTPPSNTVFNLFNYRKYLLSKKIYKIGTINKIELIKKNTYLFYTLKNKLISYINKFKSKKYLNLFILGNKYEIEEEKIEAYQNLGIIHLFSISGFHVYIIISFINKLIKNKRIKNIITYFVLFFYMFITNYLITLVRCFLYLILKDLNLYFKLKYKNITLLIISCLILILYNPYYIYNTGFIFTYVIAFFIMLFNNINKNKNKYFGIIFISFLAVVPILSCTVFKFNLLSILFNIIFMPIISYFIYPLSIITLFIPILDSTLFYMMSNIDNIIISLSEINYLNIIIGKMNYLIIFIYYVCLLIYIFKTKKILIINLLIILLCVFNEFFIYEASVTFIDVNQGDSALIVLPKGKTIMIDTGGLYNSNNYLSKNRIIPYLNSLGLNKIDYLILTHGDNDHMGEASYLVKNIKVNNVIFNIDSYNKLELELIDVLNSKGIPHYKNIENLIIGKYVLKFLNTKLYDNENDNSNVIYTDINGVKMLFTGDAGIKKEKDIINKYNIKNIDILKVGHHGSDTSSSKEFINTIKPKKCIISVGKDNRYGHPKESVIKTLENQCDIYRTDLNGSIKINLNKLKIKEVK